MSALLAAGRASTRSTGSSIFVLATFVGFEVITPRAHAAAHAAHVGHATRSRGIIARGRDRRGAAAARARSRWSLGARSRSSLATVNVVGGFVVTDRMLQDVPPPHDAKRTPRREARVSPSVARLLYLARVGPLHPRPQGLRRARARRARGNTLGHLGMVIAVVGTVLVAARRSATSRLDRSAAHRRRHRGRAGCWRVRVQMTAMPQMVALLNGLGGLASALVSIGELVHVRRHEPAVDARSSRRWAACSSAASRSRAACSRSPSSRAWCARRPGPSRARSALNLGLLLLVRRCSPRCSRRPAGSTGWLVRGAASLVARPRRDSRRSRSAAPTCRS